MAGGIKKTEIVEADLNQLSNELKIVGDNIMRIIEISAKVKPITGLTELSNATKQTSDNATELDRIGKKLALSEQRLKDLMDERTKAIIANNKATQEQTAEMKRQATIAKQVEGSYEQINASMNSNIITYKKLSQAQRENEAVGGEMIKTIQAQDAQLKQLDATMGRNQRNVGNYKSGFNGLNFSIMQVGRELPSLAYGVNVFAAAISNNIPMVTDEIKKAKLELAALKEEGKVGVPIWKQFASAIFSWQTALVVGLTLFTMYGKEIIGFIGGLFKSKDALEQNKIAQDRLNEANKKGYEDGQKDIVRLKLLYNATQSNTVSLVEKKKAIKELQDQYPDYLGKFSEEEILAGKASKAYYELSNAIMASAKAKAYEQIIVENEVKKLELETKVIEERKGLLKAEKSLSEARKQFSDVSGTEEAMAGASSMINEAQKNVDEFTESINGLNKEISAIEYSSKELADKIKPTDLLSNLGQEKGGKDSNKVKEAKDEAAELIDINFLLAKIKRDQEIEAQKEANEETKRLIKSATDEQKAFTEQTISDSMAEADAQKLRLQEVAIDEIKLAKGNKEKIADIQHELTMNMLAEDEDALQNILDTAGLELEAYEDATVKLRRLRLARNEEEISDTERTEAEKKSIRNETMQATAELLSQGLAFSQQIYSAQATRAQEAYDAEMNAAGDSLEYQTLAKRKFEAEDKKIKQRQAIASKLQAVLDAGLALALAIATTWKNPFLAALNIGAATLGLGMALATPIPQFADGVEDFEGGLAVLGDGTGKKKGRELVTEPSGKKWLSSDTPSLYNLVSGSDVTPADEVQKQLANMAFNQVREVVDLSKTNEHLASMDKQMKNKSERYTDSKGRTVVKRGNLISTL